MAKLNIELMLSELYEAGHQVGRAKNWTDEEFYNYVIHQFNLVFIKPYVRTDIAESRSMGVNTSRTVGGRFKNRNKR